MNKSEEIKSIKEAQRELANRLEALEQEPRTPKAGDVWEGNGYLGKCHYLMCSSSPDGLLALNLSSSGRTHYGCASENPLIDMDSTYLGKFDEVYCKISDVREALSIEDRDGESVLRNDVNDNAFGINSSKEALRKLNIIK